MIAMTSATIGSLAPRKMVQTRSHAMPRSEK